MREASPANEKWKRDFSQFSFVHCLSVSFGPLPNHSGGGSDLYNSASGMWKNLSTMIGESKFKSDLGIPYELIHIHTVGSHREVFLSVGGR